MLPPGYLRRLMSSPKKSFENIFYFDDEQPLHHLITQCVSHAYMQYNADFETHSMVDTPDSKLLFLLDSSSRNHLILCPTILSLQGYSCSHGFTSGKDIGVTYFM